MSQTDLNSAHQDDANEAYEEMQKNERRRRLNNRFIAAATTVACVAVYAIIVSRKGDEQAETDN